MTRLSLLALALAAGLVASPAFAQSADPVTAPENAPSLAPSTGGTTDAGEIPITTDSAVDPKTWVGKPVLSADGGSVGTLKEVRSQAPGGPAATLEVQRADGRLLTLPMEGASTDGKSVTIAATLAEIDPSAKAK